MQIFGIDFTSAPRRAKPITCAVCSLDGQQLSLESVSTWDSFAGFEDFLGHAGPWTAAIDFPFGQPRRLTSALGWPDNWEQYVQLVGKMTKQEFVEFIKQYRDQQPPGEKHHLRATDQLAQSCSPMMLYGVPVGRMFFEGAPRLRETNVSVWPCRVNDSSRVVVEGYPALVMRNLLGKLKYKSEKVDSLELASARKQLLERLQSSEVQALYSASLCYPSEFEQQLLNDEKGDMIDAVLCAVQAAYFVRMTRGHKSLPSCDCSSEGWIVDPLCMSLA